MDTIGNVPAGRSATLLADQIDAAMKMSELSLKVAKLALGIRAEGSGDASAVQEAASLLDIRA